MKGMKKFFTKFKKKGKKKEGGDPQEVKTSSVSPAPPGLTRLFGISMEIQSISTDSIPPATFEIPDGFKKQELEPPNS